MEQVKRQVRNNKQATMVVKDFISAIMASRIQSTSYKVEKVSSLEKLAGQEITLGTAMLTSSELQVVSSLANEYPDTVSVALYSVDSQLIVRIHAIYEASDTSNN